MPNINLIKNRWDSSLKVAGVTAEHTLAGGQSVKGRYYLAESGSCTASHDALHGFVMSEGFPVDRNGNSINDRDYKRDTTAQEITRIIASGYDARAIQSPVIVSPDGVVLSGNGRTMAGEIAAREGTDGAYIEHLTRYGQSYGFTRAQVERFKHPRLLLVLENNLPYTATTFALFNAKEQKEQNKTEQAVKFGKIVDDSTFARITAIINGFDTLGDFYANTEAVTRCINDLRNIGVIDAMSYGSMFDGDTISSTGKEILENVLTGKAFSDNPDGVRMITSYKSLRKSIIFALSEIANNLGIGPEYSLNKEITEAVTLAYNARMNGYKAGERVSIYARQADMFSGETVCDYTDDISLTLADALNSDSATRLKKILSVYNHQAKESAAGQCDMFCASGVKSKKEIIEAVKSIFATGRTEEQRKLLSEAQKCRISENLFIPEELTKEVKKGSYVEYKTGSGDIIICMVENMKNTIAYIVSKGGARFAANKSKLNPTASHNLTLPAWLEVGNVIANDRASQRIADIEGGFVSLEWVNGGYFDVSLSDIIKEWHPMPSGQCGLLSEIN